ncbi:3720_t:CDS:2 [Dentiscutata erythropus]|uniref:(d)CMP kinase n=1 Tax=Dentiscutata erythropus TaxID=1348616 RepID=A0A9N9ENL8_9GLOM|nr:3720_t:CDS:2 [Dentiscutata erythropus]
MQQTINIAINGYNYSKEPINNQIIFLKDLKNKLNKQQFLIEINLIEQLNDEDYLYSGKKVSELAKNNKLRKEINLITQEITKEKGYIVVGRDTTFNILPDADIKIFLSANFETRVNCRAQQLCLTEFTNIFVDILNRDATSAPLVNEARKDKCLEFLNSLLDYSNYIVNKFKELKKRLPKNRSHPYYIKSKTFRDKVLNSSKQGSVIKVQQIEKAIQDLEEEFECDTKKSENEQDFDNNSLKESSGLILSQDNDFVVCDKLEFKYITKQNGIIDFNKLSFSDEDLKMDNSSSDNSNKFCNYIYLYKNAKNNFTQLQTFNSTYYTYLNILNEIYKHGFMNKPSSIKDKINNQIEINNNLMIQNKLIINKHEQNIREFALNLLLNQDKQIALNRRNNPTKDFHKYIQSICGRKEKESFVDGRKEKESFEQYAIRETIEKANIEPREIYYICTHEGFRKFFDGVECLFRTAIYFTILDDDQIPEQTKPDKHDPWVFYDLKELHKLKLIDFIAINLNQILTAINKKFKAKQISSNHKKRKVDEAIVENFVNGVVDSVASTLSSEPEIKGKF